MLKGTVIFFETQKKYGFIAADGETDQYFFHLSDLVDDRSFPNANDRVEFEVGAAPRGPKAINIKILQHAN